MLSSIVTAKGKQWDNLFSEEDSSTPAKPDPESNPKPIISALQVSTPFSQNGNVMTLPKSDSFLYGEFPEIESFSLCICCVCGMTIKPQGLLRHMSIRHGRRIKDNKINGSTMIMKSQTFKIMKNIKLKIPTIESSSSSTTSSSSNVNSPQKTDESSNEVEFVSTNAVTSTTTTTTTFIAPQAPPVEIEPSMSPLSEILQQIQDGSNELPEITDCSLSSEHFKEVQKIIKSFEDVERSQVNCKYESLSNEEKQRQMKMLTDHFSNQERFESNESQAFNLLYNRSSSKQSKLQMLSGSDYLVFMFIEMDDQFQDLVFDRIGVCDPIKRVTDNTLAADFPHPRPPDHGKTFKEVFQDLVNTKHLLMDKYVPSSFLDVPSLSSVFPRPYTTNDKRKSIETEFSSSLKTFIETSFDTLLKSNNNTFDNLQELCMNLVRNWKFSHVTTFHENFNKWSFDASEDLLSACLDSKLWKYVCNTDSFKNQHHSTLLLNTISLLRLAELWNFLKQNYYQHLEQYQYYRFQLGNEDTNVINEITKIFPLLERRCVDLQIYIRETAIRIAYILNLQLFILSGEKSLNIKQEPGTVSAPLTIPLSQEIKFFIPFQNTSSKQTGHTSMIDNLWLGAFNSFHERRDNVKSVLALNAFNLGNQFSLTETSMGNIKGSYKRITKKISTKNPKNTKCFQSALFLNNFLTNDIFLRILKKEKVDFNIFVNSILPKGVDFVKKSKCGGTTIYCFMMDNEMVVEQTDKEKCFYNKFLKYNALKKLSEDTQLPLGQLSRFYMRKLHKLNSRFQMDVNLSSLAKAKLGGLNYLKYLTLLIKLRKFEVPNTLKGCYFVLASLEQRINDLSCKPLAESIAELFPSRLQKFLSTRVRTRDIFLSLSSGRYDRIRERIAKKKNTKSKYVVNGKAVNLSGSCPQPLRINTYNIVKFGKSRCIFRKEFTRARRFCLETTFGNTEKDKHVGSNREKDKKLIANGNISKSIYDRLRNKYIC